MLKGVRAIGTVVVQKSAPIYDYVYELHLPSSQVLNQGTNVLSLFTS
jgi:hypothetical protein